MREFYERAKDHLRAKREVPAEGDPLSHHMDAGPIRRVRGRRVQSTEMPSEASETSSEAAARFQRMRNRGILQGILESGLVSGKDQRDEGGTPFLSNSTADQGKSFISARRVTSLTSFDRVLTREGDIGVAILPVLLEREDESSLETSELPPEILEDRLRSTMMVVIPAEGITPSDTLPTWDPLETGLASPVSPSKISAILVPQSLYAELDDEIKAGDLPIIPVGENKVLIGHKYYEAPDYEGALRQMLAEIESEQDPGELATRKQEIMSGMHNFNRLEKTGWQGETGLPTLIIHGVRLYTKEDIEKEERK